MSEINVSSGTDTGRRGGGAKHLGAGKRHAAPSSKYLAGPGERPHREGGARCYRCGGSKHKPDASRRVSVTTGEKWDTCRRSVAAVCEGISTRGRRKKPWKLPTLHIIYLQSQNNGVLQMEVDTGESVSLIREETYVMAKQTTATQITIIRPKASHLHRPGIGGPRKCYCRRHLQ